jgi:hypothetical protein
VLHRTLFALDNALFRFSVLEKLLKFFLGELNGCCGDAVESLVNLFEFRRIFPDTEDRIRKAIETEVCFNLVSKKFNVACIQLELQFRLDEVQNLVHDLLLEAHVVFKQIHCFFAEVRVTILQVFGRLTLCRVATFLQVLVLGVSLLSL